MGYKLLLLLLVVVVYLVGCIIAYGIALPYFDHLVTKHKKEGEDANIEGMAISVGLMSLLGIFAMIFTNEFKWCGIKFKRRNKNGNNK